MKISFLTMHMHVTTKTCLTKLSFIQTPRALFMTSSTPLSTITSSSTKNSFPPSPSPSRILVLTGPTAIGKSDIALTLSSSHDGEIISADSVQLYRGLDVGSNKASKEDRERAVHHLLDIVDADEEFSAGDFFKAATKATHNILQREKLPIVVGGTMMYVKWYLHGRPATPPPINKETREIVEQLVSKARSENNWDMALDILKKRDEKRAEMLSKNDWYRLIRALEVFETTGKGISEMPLIGAAPNALQNESDEMKRHDDEAKKKDWDFRCIFLYPDDRISMNRRIDERCEYMIFPKDYHVYNDDDDDDDNNDDRQLVWSEVRSIMSEVTALLVTKELLVAPATPCLAIGYRQTISYLVTLALSLSSKAIPKMTETESFRSYVDDFQQATRNYAKQQMSWFRKEPEFFWVKSGIGVPATTTISQISELLSLSREDYQQKLSSANVQASQSEIKQDIIAQGKTMKRYISQRSWLLEDSINEKRAINIARQCAYHLVSSLAHDEMDQMLSVVNR